MLLSLQVDPGFELNAGRMCHQESERRNEKHESSFSADYAARSLEKSFWKISK
jgi:hypothetical protein